MTGNFSFTSMLILLPISLLILTPVFLTVLHILRPKSGLSWLVSALVTLVIWLTIMILRLRIPETFVFGSPKSVIILPFQYSFLLDKISWPYAWSLAASLLALILVSATRLSSGNSSTPDWSFWPFQLLLGGLGLWSIFSGNLNTLILSWAAIDLVWLFFMLANSNDHAAIFTTFAIRVAGLFLAIGASYTRAPGEQTIFPVVNATINTLLFLAALLRILTIGWSGRLTRHNGQDRISSPFINIVIAASALLIITRTSTGLNTRLTPIFIVLLGIIAILYAAVAFLLKKELKNITLWMVGIAILSAAAAVQTEMQASLTWGIVLVLLGSFLQYNSAQLRFSKILFVIAFIGISTFPFTPAWQGIRLYPLPTQFLMYGVSWILFLFAQMMLTAGFIQTLLEPGKPVSGAERWVWAIYPIGLVVLLLTQIVIFLFGIPGLTNDLQAFPPLSLSWASLATVVLSILGLWITRTFSEQWSKLRTRVYTIAPYEWSHQALKGLFRLTSLAVLFVEQIFEGVGGILWTILFLILLFAIFYQFGFGG